MSTLVFLMDKMGETWEQDYTPLFKFGEWRRAEEGGRRREGGGEGLVLGVRQS